MIGFDHIVEEDVSPFGADDGASKFVGDDGVSPVDIEVVEEIEAVCYLSEGLVVELVHWGCIDTEVTCYVLEVIAGCC